VSAETVPHNGTRTSRAAARSMGRIALDLRERIYAYVCACGIQGATADEIEAALRINGNTVRPRLVELRSSINPRIVDSGRTRATRSGRSAVVWWAK
jgi:hypothetical protein